MTPAPPTSAGHVLTALTVLLDRVTSGELTVEPGADGVTVLEQDGVRCVLTVVPDRPLLSPREDEIARMVAAGATTRTIARHLEISAWTVSTHVRRIFDKLDVGNRAEMVARLYGHAERSGRANDDPARHPHHLGEEQREDRPPASLRARSVARGRTGLR